MRLAPILALLLLAAQPVAARCVVAEDLATGIAFKLQDGTNWLARDGGNHMVRLDLTNPEKGFTEHLEARHGVFLSEHRTRVKKTGGRSDFWTLTEIKWTKTPPEPTQDSTWTSAYRINETQQVLSSDNWKRKRAAVRFLPDRTVSLNGCEYEVIAVEMVHSGGMSNYSERWAYFPDLGVGIRTLKRYDTSGREERSGILSMTAK